MEYSKYITQEKTIVCQTKRNIFFKSKFSFTVVHLMELMAIFNR